MYNGMGFDNLYFHQGIEKAITLIQECSAITQTGNLITSVAEGFRLQLGYNATLGKMTDQNWKQVSSYVTDCWYLELMKFFVTMNNPAERIELVDDTPPMPSLRHNDTFIMQEFVSAGVDKSKLKILNYMRMFIETITLSDITTPDGKNITFDAWNVIGSNSLRSSYDWPRKPPHFSDNQKRIWKDALHRTFSVPGSGRQCKNIRTSPWCVDSTKDIWKYYFCLDEQPVYKRVRHGWKAYREVPGPNLRNKRYKEVVTAPHVNNLC